MTFGVRSRRRLTANPMAVIHDYANVRHIP